MDECIRSEVVWGAMVCYKYIPKIKQYIDVGPSLIVVPVLQVVATCSCSWINMQHQAVKREDGNMQ